jgi:hypothetical protein
MTREAFNLALEREHERWIHPRYADRANSPRIALKHIHIFLRLVERKERDFHASLWSRDFDKDLAQLGSVAA